SLGTGYGAEAYPNMTRMDWAIELWNWFEYYLKGVGNEPEAHVQIQTNDGKWHVEETWPPEDVSWDYQDLSKWAGADGIVNANTAISIVSPAFEEEVHLSGLPTLHLEVNTRGCNGGQIFATLWDETDGLRLGHAVMDIRYRDGGYDAKPVSPFGSYTMLMEFNPLDVVLPAGHSLSLELTDTGADYLPSTCALTGLSVQGGTFGMPLVDRPTDDSRWFLSPPWWEDPNNIMAS
ncbi:MAG: CocE/NonD family hydrolase C-terminal non-catalytic domain-containing protein, partial [Candidatus Thermoplasmatota archaeon]|nr:CocE/NonD family hydrolase C-terminal non-catalytic domain-containing protein [Candidatus Thermoplasmatota archaeon]